MSPSRALWAAAALLLCLAMADASEFAAKNVVTLTSKNFKEATADGKLWLIKFYAPWCGHCKRLAPTWKELGDDYEGSKEIAIAHIDCTVEKSICSEAEVKGYPTLKLYYEGKLYKPYKGARDKESLKKFLDDAAADMMTETVS
ncbi:unnamed protein product [Ostreobium quekettii]|uniref:Thioredoxin domain-containing protein n=1 Tax=Ostreobium quekettii TaxID=121088 RepID=A0A8S1J9H6_9CHLO|nr:unnamed protein product [Ostreobium quekettii]|eukprot:evm.model.scf_411.2 EVM.evm.TU.scf_411.2   scf_411:48449-49810(-)